MRKPELKQLPVQDLIVDPNVQRALDRSRASRIAEELDMHAIGVITVSRRTNGSYHVVDGQHRVEALRLAGGDNEKVTCRIFDGLTIEGEAKLFRLLNNTTKLQAIDKFRVRVVEGEPTAVDISQILAAHGWKVNLQSTAGYFSAVAAAERIYLRDRDAFERTIVTVTRAWGHDAAAVDGRLVEGIGLVYARYGDALGDADLVEKLARYPGGPGHLLGNARGMKDLMRITLVVAVADIVVELYNKGRRTRAVPPWRS